MQSRADLIKKLVEHGLSQTDAESFADDSIRTDGFLDRRECPKCNGPLTRKLDPRQAGPTQAVGSWFNYRCPCGYMCDRVEGAN